MGCATTKKGLVTGIRTRHLAGLAQKLQPDQVEIRVAMNPDEVDRIFMQEMIEFVILGHEHDSEQRLKTLARIFAVSPSSEIHIMGIKSDPVSFITGILEQSEAE